MESAVTYSIFKTKWGFFGLLASEKGLLKVCLPVKNKILARTYLLAGITKKAKEAKLICPQLTEAIIKYYDGAYVDFEAADFSLDWSGLTDFAVSVLKACKKIKIGQTISYGQLAVLAKHPGAARAVGTVMAANRLPLIIGCHRVVCSDGDIGNFSFGGSETKKKMLEHEQQMILFGRQK